MRTNYKNPTTLAPRTGTHLPRYEACVLGIDLGCLALGQSQVCLRSIAVLLQQPATPYGRLQPPLPSACLQKPSSDATLMCTDTTYPGSAEWNASPQDCPGCRWTDTAPVVHTCGWRGARGLSEVHRLTPPAQRGEHLTAQVQMCRCGRA